MTTTLKWRATPTKGSKVLEHAGPGEQVAVQSQGYLARYYGVSITSLTEGEGSYFKLSYDFQHYWVDV